VRGVAFLGALEALKDNGHQFDRLMGSSVGGLTAALLATGHDAHSVRDLIFDPQSGRLTFGDVLAPYPEFTRQEISKSATRRLLRDIDLPFVPNLIEGASDELMAQALMNRGGLHDLFSIIEHMGIRQDRAYMTWLSDVLNQHAGGEDWAAMGLADLFLRTGRSLTVIASDITNGSMLVLNHSTAPELPVKWAIRMTTGVPFLFPPVSWRSEWGLYRKRRLQDHYIVDGALLSQFPLEFFLSTQAEIVEIMGERKAGNNVLGLLLDESEPVPGLSPGQASSEQMMDTVPGARLGRLLLQTLLNSSQAAYPLESHIIRLPVMGIGPYAFDAPSEQLVPAINAAYNVTQDFLNGWAKDPRTLLSPFEQQYAQIVAEKFVVSGDYYSIGDIVNSKGIGIGAGVTVDVKSGADDSQ
jgi:predicted acylesterase/phospholipase RssA